MAANCPECEAEIDIEESEVEIGDELSCSECGCLLRVASDRPLEFESIDDEDDLDDDEEDEDDYEDEDEVDDDETTDEE